MSLESGPKNPNGKKDVDEVALNFDKNTGEIWYKDNDGNVIQLDDAAREERNRQQQDPTSEPAEGFPRFSSAMATEPMPSPQQQAETFDPVKLRPSALNPGKFSYPGIDDEHTQEEIEQIITARAQTVQNQPAQTLAAPAVGPAALQQQPAAPAAGPAAGPAQQAQQQQAPGNQQQAPSNPNAFPSAPAGGPPLILTNMPAAIMRKQKQVPAQRPLVPSDAPTLDVILQDKIKQEQFAWLLKAQGKGDLIEKYERVRQGDTNAMSQQNWADLDGFRAVFAQREGLLNEFRGNMTSEDVRHHLNTHPAFTFMRASLQPDRAEAAIKMHMSKIFMTGMGNEIDQLIYAQRANNTIRSSEYYQNLMTRLREKAGVNALPEGIDWSALDRNTMIKILRPGFTLNPFNPESAALSSEMLGDIHANKSYIANVIAASFSKDPTLVSRVVNEAMTGAKVAEGPTGVSSMKEVGEQTEKVENIKTLRERIRKPEFKSKVEAKMGKTWATMTPAERESGSFSELQSEKLLPSESVKGEGWFATLLAAFFAALFPQTRKELANEFKN